VSDNILAVEMREGTGKGHARKLRASGKVPAVIYGHGKDSLALSFDPDALEKILKTSEAGANTLIGLEGASVISGRTVLVKELQRDPVQGYVLHADLFEVDPEERISVSVPILVVGIPEGVSMGGGILDHALREVELYCLPSAIPDALEIDVSALELGDSLHVRDLVVAQGVDLRTHEDLPIVSVVLPRVEEEPEPVEGEGVEGEEGAEGEGEGEGEGGEGGDSKAGGAAGDGDS
jgi:large subunit ribosomal protein L25